MRKSSAPSLRTKSNVFDMHIGPASSSMHKENPLEGYTKHQADESQLPEGAVRSTSRVLGLLKTSVGNSTSQPDHRNTEQILRLLPGHNEVQHSVQPFRESQLQGKQESQKVSDHDAENDNIAAGPAEAQNLSRMTFEAMFRKITTKKHKTWEGDGTVEVDGRCAILKDSDGKELGRQSRVKDDVVFEEGVQLVIGSKEVELGSLLRRCASAVPSQLPVSPKTYQPQPSKRFCSVFRSSHYARNDEFPLPEPSEEHQREFNKRHEPVNKVCVEGFLARALRPYQRDGVTFLYECVMGMKGTYPGQYWGVVLADEMGLGKSLQCIALIWTLLRQKPYGRGCEIQRALIVAPRTLCDNWEKDIYAWLSASRITLYKVDSKHSLEDYRRKSMAKVVLVSYDTYIRQASADQAVNDWDLLICDEAHCLKNPDTEKSKWLKKIKCKRKILLTGSPGQNNLEEFFELLEFANPNCLGAKEDFMDEFVRPILRSGEPECSEEEADAGEEAKEQLRVLTSQFMLRRTAEVNMKFLPGKQDLVLMCNAAPLQKKIYYAAVEFWSERLIDTDCRFATRGGGQALKAITTLRRICNHPALLKSCTGENEEAVDQDLQCHLASMMGNACDIDMEQHSGKLQVVSGILACLHYNNSLVPNHLRDRALVVSYYTQTLNVLEALCKRHNYKYCRLDGSTRLNERLPLVNKFNEQNSNTLVFLLSARAGGTGLNLTGASRLILFDLDWNPANDLQALGRVWRGRQTRPVITYRLLTAGTIEEKIFQRQIKKAGLNPTTSTGQSSVRLSKDELKDLFSYQDNTSCNMTHEMLRCPCDGHGNNVTPHTAQSAEKTDDKDSVGIPGIDQLLRWQHMAPEFDLALMQDLELLYTHDKITFMFRTEVNTEQENRD